MSANACVFAAFLAGCGLGAYLSVREPKLLKWIDRFPSGNKEAGSGGALNSLRTYGRLELLCAGSGALLFFFLGSKGADFISVLAGLIAIRLPGLVDTVRFAICYFLLLIPCTCMGSTFAVIGNASSESSPRHGKKSFPLFYGINTVGAAAGSFVAGFMLLPTSGLSITCLFAVALYVLIFLYCEFRSQNKEPGLEAQEVNEQESISSRTNTLWLALAFLSGFLAIFLEITWTRIFSLLLGGSVYSLTIVLIVILCALGAASLAVSLAKPEPRLAKFLIAACLMDTALCLLLNTSMSNYLIWSFFAVSSHIAPKIIADPFWQAIITRGIVAFVFIFPSSFFLGAILPLASGISNRGTGSLFYSANCIGSVLACLVFVAFFYSGITAVSNSLMMSALIFSAVVAAIAAATMFLRIAISSKAAQRLIYGAATLSCILIPCSLLVLRPEWRSSIMSSGSLIYKNGASANSTQDLGSIDAQDFEPLQFYKEGLNSTVSVQMNKIANTISFANDGKTEATLPIDASLISAGSDHSTHILLASLPMLMHKGKVTDALLIGAGSGMSASTFLSYEELSKLTVAEIEPAVIEACQKFSLYNGGPFSNSMLLSGRINIQPYDARFVLLSSEKKFDVISSQPADPWVSGAADLFTIDFWRLASERLRSGGIFCQWLQLYAIPQEDLISLVKSFETVFPHAMLFHPPGAGEILLLGFKDGIDQRECLRNIETKLIANHSWFEAVSGISNAYDCLALSIANSDQLRRWRGEKAIRLCTDDLPFVEYSTAKKMLTSSSALAENLEFLSSSLRHSKSEEANWDAVTASNLARAYARQYIQDSTPFQMMNKERSLSLSTKAFENSPRPLTGWQDYIIRKALGSTTNDRTKIAELKLVDEADRIALFDDYFEKGDLSNCSKTLDSCQSETKAAWTWKLRHAFLQLRQDQTKQAEKEFLDLLLHREHSLPALLGATYASIQTKNLVNARMCLTRYLSVNPWDAQSQELLALLLADDDLAYDHAKNAALLREGDASAFIPLLAITSGNSPKAFTQILQNASKLAPNSKELALVDRITTNGKHPEILLKNADFIQLVKEIQSKAEDANSGYKILGEP